MDLTAHFRLALAGVLRPVDGCYDALSALVSPPLIHGRIRVPVPNELITDAALRRLKDDLNEKPPSNYQIKSMGVYASNPQLAFEGRPALGLKPECIDGFNVEFIMCQEIKIEIPYEEMNLVDDKIKKTPRQWPKVLHVPGEYAKDPTSELRAGIIAEILKLKELSGFELKYIQWRKAGTEPQDDRSQRIYYHYKGPVNYEFAVDRKIPIEEAPAGDG